MRGIISKNIIITLCAVKLRKHWSSSCKLIIKGYLQRRQGANVMNIAACPFPHNNIDYLHVDRQIDM